MIIDMFGDRPSFSGTPNARETLLFKPPIKKINELHEFYDLDDDKKVVEHPLDEVQTPVIKKPKTGAFSQYFWNKTRV